MVKRAISGKNSWKKRYFTLDSKNLKLSYYTKPPKSLKTKPKGVIQLSATSRAAVEDFPPGAATTKVLKVSTDKKILVAVEENGDVVTLHKWVEAFNTHILKQLNPEAYGPLPCRLLHSGVPHTTQSLTTCYIGPCSNFVPRDRQEGGKD